MTLSTILCFLGASMAFSISPGPDNIFVVTQGVSRGRRAAIAAAMGMCSGVSVHTTAAALGISAVLYSSALAFRIVKYAGAAYLLYLAYKAVKERTVFEASEGTAAASTGAMFRRGFLMNVLNPKVALFFLAFLPQFVNQAAGHVAGQMILLGLLFMAQAIPVFAAIGFFSGSIGEYVMTRPKVSRGLSWLAAGVFATLGLRLALAKQ